MENKRDKTIIYMVIFASLLAIAFHLDKLSHFFAYFIDITFPLIIGSILAFILNVPMRAFQKLLSKMDKKKKWKESVILTLSLVLTLLSAVLVIALVSVIVIPNIILSIKQIYETLQDKLPEIIKTLENIGIDAGLVESILTEKSMKEWFDIVGNSAGNVLGKVMSGASTTISGVGSAGIGIVICVYILLDKRAMARRFYRLLGLIVCEEKRDKIVTFGKTVNETYSAFLTGQCLEAVILGILMVITLSIFRVPYAALIAVLAAVLSFIPYIGSFIACGFGALMIVLTDPIMALIEIVVFVVTQFIEGQFIYPRVVGNSVGLPPIFTLLAALLGGELLGIVGMIFSIPLTAVIYSFLKNKANDKENKKYTVSEAKNETGIDG